MNKKHLSQWATPWSKKQKKLLLEKLKKRLEVLSQK
tara:strand:+ start:1325 stop:1432 length:108 start_codon:yes stop_codon:yes gene_type:complete